MHDPAVRATVDIVVALLVALTLIGFGVRRVHLPLSVALVSFGLLVAAIAPARITVSPDVVLTALLPGLVFEAAFRFRLPELGRVAIRTTLLAIPGVVLVAGVVAVALHVVTGLSVQSGFLVGAIVSATDPVAVVSSMRSVGAPRQLATLVEAESLFNDGTGVLLFTIAVANLRGSIDLAPEVAAFAMAIVASLIIGVVGGFLASRITGLVDDHLLELTLSAVVAYGTYLVADGLGQSGIIATVAAGIVLGSYGREVGMSARTQQALDVVWEFVAFVLTAIVFLLIGLSISLADLAGAISSIAIGVAAIFVGRAVVVYGLIGGLRGLAGQPVVRALPGTEWGLIRRMPSGWLHVVFWSGLRGAVAFALALALPLDAPDRGLLQGTVFGVVLFTLLVQGSTAGLVVARATNARHPVAAGGADVGAPS